MKAKLIWLSLSLLLILVFSCEKHRNNLENQYQRYIGKWAWKYTTLQVDQNLYYNYSPNPDYYYFEFTQNKEIIFFSLGEAIYQSNTFSFIIVSESRISIRSENDDQIISLNFTLNPYNGFLEINGGHCLLNECETGGDYSYFEKKL